MSFYSPRANFGGHVVNEIADKFDIIPGHDLWNFSNSTLVNRKVTNHLFIRISSILRPGERNVDVSSTKVKLWTIVRHERICATTYANH